MAITPLLSSSKELFEIYAFYKKATNQVIRWMTRNAHPGIERTCLTSVKELRSIADSIISSNMDIPIEVLRTFRKALKARKRLTALYKRSNSTTDFEATETHEYFNETFERVFGDLDRMCKRSSPPLIDAVTGPSVTSLDNCNPFHYLPNCEDCAEPTRKHTPSEVVVNGGQRAIVHGTSKNNLGPSIGGDTLEEVTQLYSYLFELDQLTVRARERYENAAKGSIPLIVAAVTSNCAYQCGSSLSRTLHEYRLHDPKQLADRLTTLKRSLGMQNEASLFPGKNTTSADSGVTITEDLELIWEEVLHFTKASPEHTDSDCATRCCKECGKRAYAFPHEDPMKALTLGNGHELGKETERPVLRLFLRSVLRSMYQDVQLCRKTKNPLPLDVPFRREFEALVTKDASNQTGKCNALDLCFGLHLMYQTYQGFCTVGGRDRIGHGDAKTTTRDQCLAAKRPRLHALKLSSELMAAMRSTINGRHMPCSCLRAHGTTVVSKFVESHNVLNHFVTTIRFDLLYQAPWVAGAHAMMNLNRFAESGSQLWHYGYFVGTVLHMYNGMVQAGFIKHTRLPVLEALCNTYEGNLFPGKRSIRNVLSCWQRWTGGKVVRAGYAKKTNAGCADKKWHLCPVPDASYGNDNWRRSFHPTKVSTFACLAEGQSVLADDVVARVNAMGHRESNYEGVNVLRTGTATKRDELLSTYVERVSKVIETEFQEPLHQTSALPVARINYLAVYHASMETLWKISDENHEKPLGCICKCPAEWCLKVCEEYLRDCRGPNGTQAMHPVASDTCNSCLTHLLEVFDGKSCKDFLWDVSLA